MSSTEGLTRELKVLYDVGNSPNRAYGNLHEIGV